MAKKGIKKTFLGLVYMITGCTLIYVLCSSAMSVLSTQDDIAKLEKEVAQVTKEKEDLENEIDLLNNDDYVTRYARENYVFTREGEEVAILPETDSK